MNKVLEIKVIMTDRKDHNDSLFDTEIKMIGNPVDITAMAMQAMYMLNRQFNDAIKEVPKNAFWNCLVEQMGERLLEESKK